jgi:predicted ferric reductase
MLLHRIEALFELVLSNKIVALIYFIFTIFIWCLEFLVILFKINSAETNYEKKIRMIEQMGSSRMDKLVRIDNEWHEAGRAHNSTQEVRNSINKKSPTIYN